MAHQLRAQSIVGFAPLVTELGGDARQLLRNAGLDPAELEQPDIYILHRAFIQLLEDAADGLRCPDFGLRLLDRQDLSVLGPSRWRRNMPPTCARPSTAWPATSTCREAHCACICCPRRIPDRS